MNKVEETVSTAEARAAVDEIRAVAQAASVIPGDGAPTTEATLPDFSEDQVERMRKRAERQRSKGRKELSRRHDGVASMVTNVSLKERVIGSSFERFFATIESGVSLIERRGEMIVGEKAATDLINKVNGMLDSMSQELEASEAALQTQMTVASAMAGFVKPVYTGDAASHEVQIRTRTAVKALNLFYRYDKILQDMQVLFWNGHVYQKFIEDMELEAKHAFQKIFKFIKTTITGFYNKTAGGAGNNRGQAANGVAAGAAEGTVAEAA